MGFFSFAKQTLGRIGSAIRHSASAAYKTVRGLSAKVIKTAGSAVHTAGSAISTVYHDVGTAGKYLVDTEAGIVKGFQGTVSNLGGSFAWPLAAAAGAVGVAYIAMK